MEEEKIDEELEKIENFDQLDEWENGERLKIKEVRKKYDDELKDLKDHFIGDMVMFSFAELFADWLIHHFMLGCEDVIEDPTIPNIIAMLFIAALLLLFKGMEFKALYYEFTGYHDQKNKVLANESEETSPLYDELYKNRELIINRLANKKNS